jgi:DNA excision repair protein ERCC-4
MARRPRKTLEPGDVTAVIDTREGLPYDLAPLKQKRLGEGEGLKTGDYSILGLEHLVSVERKSLADLLGCIGQNRERFDAEMQRLIGYPKRLLLLETSWAEIERGEWRQQVKVEAVIGSILGWQRMNIPVELAGDRARAQRHAVRFLFGCAKDYWSYGQSFRESLRIAPEADDVCSSCGAKEFVEDLFTGQRCAACGLSAQSS